jgi:hypothetical protein
LLVENGHRETILPITVDYFYFRHDVMPVVTPPPDATSITAQGLVELRWRIKRPSEKSSRNFASPCARNFLNKNARFSLRPQGTLEWLDEVFYQVDLRRWPISM